MSTVHKGEGFGAECTDKSNTALGGRGRIFFFFLMGKGGGMGKGLRSDSKRTGSEGGKTGRHRRMQTIPFIVVIVL